MTPLQERLDRVRADVAAAAKHRDGTVTMNDERRQSTVTAVWQCEQEPCNDDRRNADQRPQSDDGSWSQSPRPATATAAAAHRTAAFVLVTDSLKRP